MPKQQLYLQQSPITKLKVTIPLVCYTTDLTTTWQWQLFFKKN
ncbi:hypothetical protein [Lactobacillus sp. CBA3606]|nr:hypothetical protein [Lactobacillus sp. CBA3606]